MINGEWGSGKTVFLGICADRLGYQTLPKPDVLHFNAWQQSYTKNPLVDLTHSITTALDRKEGKRLRRMVNRAVKNVALGVNDQIARRTLGIVNPAAIVRRVPNRSQLAAQQLTALRQQLEKAATKRLVVLIDELDRCDPSYALGLIESAYHVFKVPGVYVILAANRNALEQSIKVTHGPQYDAERYLRRFIDEQLTLPDPGAKRIADLLMSRLESPTWFDDADRPRCWDTCRVLALVPLSSGRSIRDLEVAQRLLQRLVANIDRTDSSGSYSGGLSRTDLINYAALLIAARMLSEPAFEVLVRSPTAGASACARLLDTLQGRFSDEYSEEETMYYFGRLVGLLLSIGGTTETATGPDVQSRDVGGLFNDAGMADISSTVLGQRRRHAQSDSYDRTTHGQINLPIAQWGRIIMQELPLAPPDVAGN